MAVVRSNAFDELYEFLVSTPTPQQILDFRPSAETHERVLELRRASNEGELTAEQAAEYDEFLKVEHFVRMLKIKAKIKLMNQ